VFIELDTRQHADDTRRAAQGSDDGASLPCPAS
jgi:hypothetical protein